MCVLGVSKCGLGGRVWCRGQGVGKRTRSGVGGKVCVCAGGGGGSKCVLGDGCVLGGKVCVRGQGVG